MTMENKTLFIVSSAISITSNPLSYSSIRSSFTAVERARHTLNTILSIRAAMPNAKILLIETGRQKELPYQLEEIVDKYVYLGNKQIIRHAVDGPYKGLGEALGLYLANRWIRQFNTDYYFKISGRYFLNDEFTATNWTGDGYSGKYFYGNFYTVFYGFPDRLYNNWRSALKLCIPELLRGEALESALPRNFEHPVFCQTKLGVSGCISHSGEFVSL